MVTKVELLTRRMPRVYNTEQSNSLPSEQYLVSEEWVTTAFLSGVVRLGTGAEALHTAYPPLREISSIQLSPEDIETFSSRIDRNVLIIPSLERYRHLQHSYNLPNRFGQAEQALTVLLHPFFRKGSYETMGADYIQSLYRQLRTCSEYGQQLQIIVPTLPFKDQCAVTTRQRVDAVDLGERLFLMRLDLMARSVASASHLRTVIQVVADGSVYADIFTQHGNDGIVNYLNRCRDLVNLIGAAENIKITDMQDIISNEPRFGEVKASIRENLSQIIVGENESVNETWQALLRGMLFNCQLPEPFNEYEAFSSLAHLELNEIRQRHPEVYEIISRAGLEYASFLLTMRRLNILGRTYQGSGVIRATVHPKRNQLGLHTLGSEVAPYNGVTVVNMEEFQRDPRITNERWYSCQRFYRVLQENENLSQVVDQNGDTFCYSGS